MANHSPFVLYIQLWSGFRADPLIILAHPILIEALITYPHDNITVLINFDNF